MKERRTKSFSLVPLSGHNDETHGLEGIWIIIYLGLARIHLELKGSLSVNDEEEGRPQRQGLGWSLKGQTPGSGGEPSSNYSREVTSHFHLSSS